MQLIAASCCKHEVSGLIAAANKPLHNNTNNYKFLDESNLELHLGQIGFRKGQVLAQVYI